MSLAKTMPALVLTGHGGLEALMHNTDCLAKKRSGNLVVTTE